MKSTAAMVSCLATLANALALPSSDPPWVLPGATQLTFTGYTGAEWTEEASHVQVDLFSNKYTPFPNGQAFSWIRMTIDNVSQTPKFMCSFYWQGEGGKNTQCCYNDVTTSTGLYSIAYTQPSQKPDAKFDAAQCWKVESCPAALRGETAMCT